MAETISNADFGLVSSPWPYNVILRGCYVPLTAADVRQVLLGFPIHSFDQNTGCSCAPQSKVPDIQKLVPTRGKLAIFDEGRNSWEWPLPPKCTRHPPALPTANWLHDDYEGTDF